MAANGGEDNVGVPRGDELAFAGQVAVVLGGGSVGEGLSIGRALALCYARGGAHTVVADVNADSASETVAHITAEGGAAEPVVVDVLNDDALHATLQSLESRLGRIDILHGNVGLGRSGPTAATTPADWRRIADANVTSLHVATQAVLPGMRARHGGVLLVTSSVASMADLGFPHVAYGATKAAANTLMRLLAIENAPYGIRANSIVAGLMDTPRIATTMKAAYEGADLEAMKRRRASQVPLGRMGTPWDVAHAALFLASARGAYITGTELLVDGGLTATTRAPPTA